jgi:hypothetical protein
MCPLLRFRRMDILVRPVLCFGEARTGMSKLRVVGGRLGQECPSYGRLWSSVKVPAGGLPFVANPAVEFVTGQAGP